MGKGEVHEREKMGPKPEAQYGAKSNPRERKEGSSKTPHTKPQISLFLQPIAETQTNTRLKNGAWLNYSLEKKRITTHPGKGFNARRKGEHGAGEKIYAP